MPKLPDSTAFGQRSAPQPSTGVVERQASPVGREIANFGAVLSQVGEEVSKKNDEQAVFEARRKLDEWERSTLYDPEKGVVAMRGADALDLPKKIPGEFDKFAGEVGSTLTTNRQRQIFQDMAQSRRNQVADFTIRHAVQQKEVYEQGQVNADMAASSDRAVMLATNGDPNSARAEVDVANARLMSFMKARGASGEAIAQAIKTNASSTHEAVVRSMVNNGDPTGAKAYLDANASAMLEKDRTQAAGLLKEGVMRAKAQGFADEVMGQDMTMADALAKARERFTGDEEVAATQEIKTRFAEKEASRAQEVRTIRDTAWSVLMEKGSMSAIPPTLMTQLREKAPEEERRMRDWLDAKYRQHKADAEGKDQDPQVYYGLRLMAGESPDEFSKLDLMKSAPYMSKQHLSHLIELQGAQAKGDMKAMESQRVMKSTLQTIKNEVAAAGIDLTLTEKDKGTQKAKDTTAFLGALGTALDEATAAKGKPLTNEEARRIGMGMLREGVEQGSGIFGLFQTKKRGFEIATDPNIKPGSSFVAARFDDIPKPTRDALTAELRQARNLGTRPLTSDQEAEIERAYTRGVQQGRFK